MIKNIKPATENPSEEGVYLILARTRDYDTWKLSTCIILAYWNEVFWEEQAPMTMEYPANCWEGEFECLKWFDVNINELEKEIEKL